MFSKTIFKQTLNQNWKLWAIFTALSAVMSAVVIAVYDPKLIQTMMDMVKDMPGMAEMMGDRMESATSLLGMLGESFYGMQGVILPLIFVIMTANSLVASKVDRGSMAYTLSTPIKRTKVVATQALYMVTSVLAMFLVITIVGLGTVQIAHNGLWGEAYTADVKAAAETLEIDNEETSDNLNLILENPDALKAGAEARGIEQDVYTAYLTLRQTEKAYDAAAEILDVSAEELEENPLLIKGDAEALDAAAEILNVKPEMLSVQLDQTAAQLGAETGQSSKMQEQLLAGITAAAAELDMEAGDLANDMAKIKDDSGAMEAAVSASGLPEEMIAGVINQQLAGNEINLDHGIDFDVKDYLMLNLGIFLLMFAISGISFLFSCIFNLTKNSLAFGAGIPIAFLILQIMSQASDSLEKLKYASLNTLFSPSEITGGGTFVMQFVVLAALGCVLYFAGIKVFKEKDLPL
jgi:ABC-2 type transport system permease protein